MLPSDVLREIHLHIGNRVLISRERNPLATAERVCGMCDADNESRPDVYKSLRIILLAS